MRPSFSVLFATLLGIALGLPSYPRKVPNSLNVRFNGELITAMGHLDPFSDSPIKGTNEFGRRVDANVPWSQLCNEDSDGDGLTNGVELCDPQCTWTEGDPDPVCQNGAVLSSPGINNEKGLEEGDITAFKIHGWLMVLAWIVVAPFGILQATLLKKSSSKSWFRNHRNAMTAVVVLNVLAFAVVMLKDKGSALESAFDSASPASDSKTHSLMGLFVVVSSVFQALSGYLRPHNPPKGEEKNTTRTVWEIMHGWFGRILLLLAFITVFYGLQLIYSDPGRKVGIALFVFGSLVGVGTILFVFLFRQDTSDTKGAAPVVAQEVKAV